MNVIKELFDFNKTCDEFISGKYILVDIKINSILKIISNDEKIKNIVSSCLQDFNFDATLKQNSLFNGENYSLTIPSNDKDTIAFIYTLLHKFSSKDIDFYRFLTTYFNQETSELQFNTFAKTIIEPFKNALNVIYSKRHVIVDSSDYQKNYYNKIMTNIKLIVKNLDNYKLNMTQKEEFTMLLNSLFVASEKNDKKLVFSIMIGLDYFSKVNKKTREAYLSLEECFEN